MVNARDETPKPRPIEGVDVRRLPIGPEEAYVHSRVDGLSSTDEIALASGLDLDRVKRCLRRLSELGAIVIEDGGQPSPINEVSGEHSVQLTVDGEGRAEPMATGTAPLGPTELEVAADLAPERQQQILLAEVDAHPGLAGSGVARHVGEGLLDNSVGRRLQLRRGPLLRERP